MTFREKFFNSAMRAKSNACLGLDIDITRTIFGSNYNLNRDLFPILKDIVDANRDCVSCFKPQIAFYSAFGLERTLEKICAYISDSKTEIPVILDAKRGDIGNTAKYYAKEAFVRYNVDAVTVNPYMGRDTIEPFLRYDGKGVFVLAKTSNKSSSEIQDIEVKGKKLYQYLMDEYEREFGGTLNYIIGANSMEAIQYCLAKTSKALILAPGIGAQGADISTFANLSDGERKRMIFNVSRSAMYGQQGFLNSPQEISKYFLQMNRAMQLEN